MPDINITVAHKVAVSDTQSIVCDNSDYTVHWTLDEDWSAYDTKTMRTIYMDGTFTDKVFSGAEVELPVCTVPGVVQIGLFAGDIRTSRVAIMRALPSVRSAAGAPADPTPDVYDQIMEIINGLGSVDPDDIAKAVADYLAAHPIEETDPTVPEWAKAETKPTYSAAEVGAISQADLQAATNAALAQAKSSGEFDGATGPAGPQGPAGAPGKDGAGMDITGAAVGQIAKIAAVDASGVPTAWSPMDMPTGGETWEIIDTIILLPDVASYILTKVAGWRKIKLTIDKTYKNTGSGNCWLGVYTGNAENARCLLDSEVIKYACTDMVVDVLGFYQLTASYGNNVKIMNYVKQSHKFAYTADITATSVLRLDVDATYAAAFDGTGKIRVEGVRA